MRRFVITAFCCLALLLPVRLRVLLAEAVGWCYQLAYWVTYRLARFLLRTLKD